MGTVLAAASCSGRGRLDGRMAGHAGLCRALCPAVAVSHFSGSEISNHKLAGACLVWIVHGNRLCILFHQPFPDGCDPFDIAVLHDTGLEHRAGHTVLGERLSLQRTIALVLGLAGLFVILGLGVQIPWPRNLGDWLALISGMAWSYGTFCLFRMGQTGVVQQVYVFVLGSLVVSVAAIIIGGASFGASASLQDIQNALPTAIMVSLFVLPMIFLTLWPAAVLSPGRVGLLLMGEVVVGIGSAAWLSGEPFGMREFTGALLIASAGLVEVIRRPG